VIALLVLTTLELFYFFSVKQKTSVKEHIKTPAELEEVARVKRVGDKGKEELKQREELIKKEATKSAGLKPFSQAQSCYSLDKEKALIGATHKTTENGLAVLTYEGRLKSVKPISQGACFYYKLDLDYTAPYSLLLPKDLLWETQDGNASAGILKHDIGRRLALAFAFEDKNDKFWFKKWEFVRFYVE
jgi:hypothetical protein